VNDKTQLLANLVHFECECSCCIEPVTQQTFNQTAARYNDRSAFANNLQQDSVVQMQNMFQAQAQNSLEQTPGTNLTNLLAQMQAMLQALQP
jgi:hypothetical protein